MKQFLLLFLLTSSFTFSQEQKEKYPKQDLFFSLESQAGLNLADILRKKPTNPNKVAPLEKTYFSYGFSAMAGYHFIPRFSISGGFKYNYITANIHPVYLVVQPRYYFNIDDESPLFLGIYFGNKVNQTIVKTASVYGINLGQMNPLTEKLNFTGNVFVENHFLDGNGHWFIGLNFGLHIFTGKNYY